MIKVITGIRRCGKSYLLFNLYYNYLLSIGIDESRIIKVELDNELNIDLLDPTKLGKYVREKIKDDGIYYCFLDEVQFVPNFEKVLNGLNRIDNLDIYVTGSNSKFLSSDILTEFRGRGDEIRVYPFSYSEFLSGFNGTNEDAWKEYITYGGLPLILSKKTDEEKANYLTTLFDNVYFMDIINRYNIHKINILEKLINVLASSIGSLTNPLKLYNTFVSNGITGLSNKTINNYLEYLLDSFMINKVERYDIKGKKYISTTSKYYFTDIGLRNARLNFRQQEENHIMENIIYNELLSRGLNVDIGVVEYNTLENEKKKRKQLEVDFVCNQGSKRYYIQSAFSIPDEEKMNQEKNSLVKINDSFKKIIIVKDNIKLWRNDDGIVIMGIEEFLLNKNSLDL
ncbi:MAG: ATP-binding protein [Bacilli bacterium]